MSNEKKDKQTPLHMRLVLAPGCADASEGTVCLVEKDEILESPTAPVLFPNDQVQCDYKIYADKQPGEGFWSIAPGCGDISEGMVWVAVSHVCA